MIIYGLRMFGKTDAVPGLFYVHTRFFHIDFIPLCPTQTYLILELRGEANRAIEIPTSGRSILVAWLRFLSVLFSLLFFFLALASLDDPSIGASATFFGLFAASCSLVGFAMCGKTLQTANYETAVELCSHLGQLGPLYRRKIDQHFSRSNGIVLAEATVLEDHEYSDEEEGFTDEVEVEVTEISKSSPQFSNQKNDDSTNMVV